MLRFSLVGILFALSIICLPDSLALSPPPQQCRREWCRDGIQGVVVGGISNLLVPDTSSALAVDDPVATPLPPTATSTRGPYLMEEYFQSPITAPKEGRFYFPTLTPPFAGRATHRYDLGRHAHAFEQLLTFANVSATIRCNVVQLEETGGLWVHSPQWPTGEFCSLLDDLGAPVEHVVLPANALEHKAPMKAFARKYPDAKVWVSPGQYGPFGSCGLAGEKKETNMGYRVDGILGDDMANPPSWLHEFEMATLYVDIPENAGPVSEVAFCHRPTKTLVATDAVVYIPQAPPPIFSTYFGAETVSDPSFWPKTVLQAVFLPLRTDSNGNNYPGYEALKNRLVRAPILRAFADARAPDPVRDWVDKIAGFGFDRILTSHFASPIAATPQDFASCFRYLTPNGSTAGLPSIACQDWGLLEGLNEVIAENKLGAPAVFDYKQDCR